MKNIYEIAKKYIRNINKFSVGAFLSVISFVAFYETALLIRYSPPELVETSSS